MLNIQLENPSFEQYIKEFGKQEIEKMFLSFLEIKAKLNQASSNYNLKKFEELNVPIELHRKLLAMKPSKEKEADLIISNNKKDFTESEIFVLKADEFYALYMGD